MRLPISENNVKEYCSTCENFKGVLDDLDPLKDIKIINCFSRGEREDDNCISCINTFIYVGKKYNPLIAYYISREFSK